MYIYIYLFILTYLLTYLGAISARALKPNKALKDLRTFSPNLPNNALCTSDAFVPSRGGGSATNAQVYSTLCITLACVPAINEPLFTMKV